MNFLSQVLCSLPSFSFILRQHERMKAPGRGASRALSQLAKYTTQCLRKTSRTSSVARHNSTSTKKYCNAYLRPTAFRQLISEGCMRSPQGHVTISGEQILFAQARRHFSVSRISQHNDLVPPKPGEEYVKSQSPLQIHSNNFKDFM